MQDQKLMDYFKFDEADLAANRNGQLSDKQHQRLSKQAATDYGWSLVIEFIVAIGFIGGGVVAIAGGGITRIVIGIVCFALALLFVWWGITNLLATLQVRAGNLSSVTVNKAEGPINLKTIGGDGPRDPPTIDLKIGGKVFHCELDLQDLKMKTGDEYSIYYQIWKGNEKLDLDAGNILSAELISKAK